MLPPGEPCGGGSNGSIPHTGLPLADPSACRLSGAPPPEPDGRKKTLVSASGAAYGWRCMSKEPPTAAGPFALVRRVVSACLDKAGLRSTIARNSVFLMAGEVLARAVNFLISIAVFRYLPPGQMGDLRFILTYGILFSVVAEAGLTRAAVLETARLQATGVSDARALEAVLGRLSVLRCFTGVLCIGLVALSFLLTPDQQLEPELKPLILLWTCTVVLQAFRRNAEVAFQASQRLQFQAAFLTVSRFVAAAAVGIAILTDTHLIGLLLAYVVTDLLDAAAANGFAWKRIAAPKFRRAWAGLWPLALAGVPFGLQLLANNIYYYIDVPMLKYLLPWPQERIDREIGYYGCAYHQLVLTLFFVPVSLCNALFPAVSRAWHSGDHLRVRSLTSYSLKLLGLAGMVIATGLFLFRAEIIGTLFPRYLPAAPMLAIVVWTLPLAFVAGGLGGLFASTGAQRVVMASAFANAAFNITLNYLLIPRLGGVGASLATTATEGFCLLTLLCAALFSSRRTFLGARSLLPLVAYLGAVLVVVVLFVDGQPLPLRASVYAAFLLCSGAWGGHLVRARLT